VTTLAAVFAFIVGKLAPSAYGALRKALVRVFGGLDLRTTLVVGAIAVVLIAILHVTMIHDRRAHRQAAETAAAQADSLRVYARYKDEAGRLRETVARLRQPASQDSVRARTPEPARRYADGVGGTIGATTRIRFDVEPEGRDGTLVAYATTPSPRWALSDTLAGVAVSLDLVLGNPESWPLHYTLDVDPLPQTVTLTEVIRPIDPRDPHGPQGTDLVVDAPGTVLDVDGVGGYTTGRGTPGDPTSRRRTSVRAFVAGRVAWTPQGMRTMRLAGIRTTWQPLKPIPAFRTHVEAAVDPLDGTPTAALGASFTLW
jgi:hypothetical protein